MEDHAVPRPQFAAIVGLELLLRRRKRGTERIVDQIQDQPAVGMAVPQRIQPAQCGDGPLENPVSPLCIDVLFEVAGE